MTTDKDLFSVIDMDTICPNNEPQDDWDHLATFRPSAKAKIMEYYDKNPDAGIRNAIFKYTTYRDVNNTSAAKCRRQNKFHKLALEMSIRNIRTMCISQLSGDNINRRFLSDIIEQCNVVIDLQKSSSK